MTLRRQQARYLFFQPLALLSTPPILIQVKSDIQELALPVVAIHNLSSNKLKQHAVSLLPHSFRLSTLRRNARKTERRMLL